MKKAIAYIDGQNTFHALKKFNVEGHHYNYRKLVEEFTEGKDLAAIKYYGAIYPGKVDQTKSNRDDAFYKHLVNDQNIQVVYGNFKINTIDGKKIPYEKGVDVRLATDLIFDAVYRNYEIAYVFSNDTDLIPAIQETLRRFDVKIFNVSLGKNLKEFQETCTNCLRAFESVVKKHASNDFKPSEDTLKDLAKKFPQKNSKSKGKEAIKN